MTIGERIQYYRKKAGLSQEELGSKLFVSRQTVSLWEMDKTMPTIENLMLLKDLFKISVDDILSDDEPREDDAQVEPKEKIEFSFSKKEFKKLSRAATLPNLIRLIILFVVGIGISIFLIETYLDDYLTCFFIGVFSASIIYSVLGYVRSRKAWKKEERIICQTTFAYEVYDDHFIRKNIKRGELRKTEKVYFNEIEFIRSIGDNLVIGALGRSYIIKKDALAQNSAFFNYFDNSQKKSQAKNPDSALRIVSQLLFFLSIASIIFALMTFGLAAGIDPTKMWVFFLFLPIPFASIIFGIYLKRKGYRFKKNVIVGIIMAAALIFYGSFSFILAGIYSNNDEPVKAAERMLQIDIPNYSRSEVSFQDWTKSSQNVSRGYIYSTTDIHFDDYSVKAFEEDILQNEKWMRGIPTEMIGITSPFCDTSSYDYYIIYNVDTNEFNKLPSDIGSYRLINLLYDPENNSMMLVDYQIEYKK